MKMGGGRGVIFAVAVAVAVAMAVAVGMAAEEKAMEEKCGADFQKLAVCLTYATGKAPAPTKDCCESVKGIKESEPECLCFIMQQTHGGNDKIKSMGIQEAKLFQLPTACALNNASMQNCPKLLGLAPNSPDAAIFTSNSSAASTTPAGSGSGSGSGMGIGSSQPGQTTTNGIGGPTINRLVAPLAIALAAFLLF